MPLQCVLFGNWGLNRENVRRKQSNIVAAGYVPTKFAASLTESEAARRAIEEQTLLGRLGTAGDMAAAVAYLASEDAAYVTSETLVIAGGMQSRM